MQKRLLLTLVPTLVVTTVLASWLVWKARSVEPTQTGQTPAGVARADSADPQLRRILELSSKKNDPKSWDELVALYASTAGDPKALTARRLTLNVLFSEPALGLRLKRVLEAVNADPTPPREDPLWPELVESISQQWSGAAFDKGRDLMLMDTRPRARRALIASFAELATSERGGELEPEQAQALLTDLIDMHARAEPEQRPQIEEGVRKLGGNDPADLLAGGGITAGKKLELQAEYERNLQVGLDTLGQGKPLPTQ